MDAGRPLRVGIRGPARALGLSVALLGLATPAAAIDLEKLVMPGKVILGHADVEGDCQSCHAPFEAEAQDSLCVECHEEVGSDLEGGTGFHGLTPAVSAAACKDCHTEHRGRDADIVGLDHAGFEHDRTDYPLHGAHRSVACAECHQEDQAFREAPADCVACHREDDAHRGQLGEACADCHVERGWREARFDHDETDFPLEGEHRTVDCSLCHPGHRFEDTASDCQSCHRLNDEHMGRFGPKCEACHSPAAWDAVLFDHGRDTKFPLRGRHLRTRCRSCHTGSLYGDPVSSDCASCHGADDVHRGRNGSDCERCHSAEGWQSETFDHERMTDFPLRGAHARTKCERCHVGPLEEQELSAACYSCHRTDDVHAGQQGRACESCHNERGWTVKVFFEHDLTRFPLLGLHAVAACEQCHATTRFRDVRVGCEGCHRDDDVHLQRLGPRCDDCHNPNGWDRWQFDHTTQTDFPLRGPHVELDCHACHAAPVSERVAMPMSCDGCHAGDDPHNGAFGHDCGRCHRGDAWRDVQIGR